MRRSWLLGELSGPLDYLARDRARLNELLAVGDRELMAALAGRRASELTERYAHVGDDELAPAGADAQSMCRHCLDYPPALRGRWAAHMLHVWPGAARLAQLARGPLVALVGTAKASDYGMAIAASMARGLAASGVTVVAAMSDGIALAAHSGALEARGASVAVLGGGLGVSCPARMRSLYERVGERGCAVAELPLSCDGRRWGAIAAERIVVGLASVTVVVEAAEPACAPMVRNLDRVLAAVPGRVSSPLSSGTNALLMEGARLVRDAADVIELLGPGAPHVRASNASAATAQSAEAVRGAATATADGLQPELREMLERVGVGEDTPARLTRAGEDPLAVLMALSELELMGLLGRGDGGRYVPREPLFAHHESLTI
jgi:DNA processing protein